MKPRRISVEDLHSAAPRLPASAPLIVFDNICVLCSGFVQWVVSRDRQRRFWFTSAQGPLGQSLYRELGLDPVNFETNLVVVRGVAHGKLDAFAAVATELGGVWRTAAVLRLLPGSVSDALYDSIARNRYRLFGKRETCWLPSADLSERVI